jgi:8-oxo-dGTP diphosphatase
MTADAPTDDAPGPVVPTVVAAGGVVLDDTTGAVRVLVVHRPAYDDWSLPKGHVDTGESPFDASVREVVEETGVSAHVTGEAGTTEHAVTLTRAGTMLDAVKRVHWFTMHPAAAADDPAGRAADDEVDVAAWWPVERALTDLTHATERQLLARVLDVQATDVRATDGDPQGGRR